MIYLGIHVGHGASASLMIDGKVILAYQEERFNNVKNFVGYPRKSVQSCLNFIKNKKLNIDKCGFSTLNHYLFPLKYPLENYFTIKDWINYYLNFFSKEKKFKYARNVIKGKKKINNHSDFNKIKKKHYNNYSLARKILKNLILKQSKGLINNVVFIDHHTCHAFYAAYAPIIKENNSAIVTIDSEGDGINQTLWSFDKKKKKLINIIRNKECELARIYRFITLILKMKPNEHEFKVMGLAPYSKIEYSMKVYNEIFKDILDVKNCKVIHKNRPKDLFRYLYIKTKEHRFDSIAGAVQILVEKISSKLITQIIKKFKLSTFSISGGVSMNIKMNKTLSEIKSLKRLYVAPTGSDESLSIGACYFLNRSEINHPLKNIYLGQKISEEKISINKVKSFFKNKKKFIFKKNVNHYKIANLLAKGRIIAVARGKEEFGARALGNRSILAHPYKNDVVQKINEQIKNRDFWMPFALTILKKYHKKFINNDKSIDCNFMTVGFDTKAEKHRLIKNGIHPYDKSVRPQILDKEFNEEYHSLLTEFYKISKVPALLNTSLNLHGFPISSTLKDVIFTFINSGLRYLYLEDKYLIIKK